MKNNNGKLLSGLIVSLVLGSYGWTGVCRIENAGRIDYVRERVENKIERVENKIDKLNDYNIEQTRQIAEVCAQVKAYYRRYAKE